MPAHVGVRGNEEFDIVAKKTLKTDHIQLDVNISKQSYSVGWE
uniref:Uncharacterized protein n=1 Tax=Anguilla anguilla TaxID=7936 RepID=A0A0E9PES4_ANGAN